jgi:hypothetical protein
MKLQVGMPVQYFTTRTMAPGGVRMQEPIPVGPVPALVHEVKLEGVLNLVVFSASGRHYLATDVTLEPTTRIQHYWRPIPQENDDASDQ